MTSFRTVAWSSVGKKAITGITGFLLFAFVCVHLIGNLTLLIPDGGEAFNHYAHFLENAVHGWLIYAFEAGLIAVAVFHMLAAVYVAWVDKRSARPVKYKMSRKAGGNSRKTLASSTMIYTGLIVIVFVVFHVRMFKFADHPTVTYEGVPMKDLYVVVAEAFNDPWIVGAYVAVMILLGLHLRHGFWSAFQSLGWASDKWLPLLTRIALVLAVLLAIGFLLLPLYMFILVDPVAGGVAGR